MAGSGGFTGATAVEVVRRGQILEVFIRHRPTGFVHGLVVVCERVESRVTTLFLV